MKRYLSLLILFLSVMVTHAQLITIKDKENHQPLELVTLSSESPQASAITNARGQADITAFLGSSLIDIRILGYSPVIRSYRTWKRQASRFIMTQSAISLDQVVVSATRWSQVTGKSRQRSPQFLQKKLLCRIRRLLQTCLGSSGEVFIQKSQLGGGSPMIRGFSTNRLLIVVDGVRMNTAIFRSGNLQNVISLDPFAIGKTEVFFGPGSVIYGSDAIGGVMSFQTLKATPFTGRGPVCYRKCSHPLLLG